MANLSRSLLIGCVAACSLFAQQTRKPVFVSPEQLNLERILPGPPEDGSPQSAAEIAELHRLQDTRSAEQIARAKADDAEEDIFIFKDVLGERFKADALPLTAVLSSHLHNDEGVVAGAAKKSFRRPRPYQADATIKPVCKVNSNPADYAYPSGHSTTGYLEALALMMMVPEKRDAIMARADEYAHNRVVCGVHYTSDVMASKSAAYAMMGQIVNHPQFKKELEAARAETRRALGLPVPVGTR